METSKYAGAQDDERLHDPYVQTPRQDGQSQTQTAKRRVQNRRPDTGRAHGSQEKQKDKRQPDCTLEHIGPLRVNHEPSEGEADSGDDRREAAQSHLAGQGEHETGAQEMRKREPLMVQLGRKHSLAVERKQGKQQMERIKGCSLHFSSEAVTPKGVWIPKRQDAPLDIGDPEIEPRVCLMDPFRFGEKRELPG